MCICLLVRVSLFRTGRSGSAASTAPASSNTGAIPASATSSNSSTSSAGSAGSLSSGAIAAPAAAMSQTVGVVKGDHFSIDLSGPEFTVDPGLVPPVQLKNAGNVGELVHPYSVPERISARYVFSFGGGGGGGVRVWNYEIYAFPCFVFLSKKLTFQRTDSLGGAHSCLLSFQLTSMA